jgi:hypothetical protein
MKSITQHNTAAARTPGPGRQTERTTRRRLRLEGRARTASARAGIQRRRYRRSLDLNTARPAHSRIDSTAHNRSF